MAKSAVLQRVAVRAEKVRLDFNENHDERGRFSSGAVGSSSSTIMASNHATKMGAEAHAMKESARHNGLHTVYDNKTKAYVSSFRGGKVVPVNAQEMKDRASHAGLMQMERAGRTKDRTEFPTNLATGQRAQGKYGASKATLAKVPPGTNAAQGRARIAEAAKLSPETLAKEPWRAKGIPTLGHEAAKSAATTPASGKGGRINPTPDEFAKHVHESNFSVLTAANPASQTTDSATNSRRMMQIYHELKERGATYIPTVGKYGNKEPSVMVMHDANFTKEHAEEMGAKYGQTSVMHSLAGQGIMHYTTGPRAGKEWSSLGKPSFDPSKTDFYTGHQGNRFSYDFPDEAFPNEKGE